MHAAIGDLVRLCTVDWRRPTRDARASRRSVVHLVPSMAWGGAERLACTLHRLASEGGWSSRVDAPNVATVREGIGQEIGHEPAPVEGEADLRTWALGARARIARTRPDVVHAHLAFPDRLGPALLAARGRPFVATFQLLPARDRYWSLDELIGNRSDNVLRVLSRLPSRTRFVAVSRSDHARLAELIPTRRLVLVGNAPPYARTTTRPLPPFGWPDGAVRLLSAGRLHPQKGYDRLLDALASPPARDLAWHWLLAGDGPDRAALEARAAERGVRERLSFASDRPASALYPTADLVLAPSRWEGMPLVPMEAVESNTAVLASDIEPHRELFAQAPDSVLPADEAAWPQALARVIGSKQVRETLRGQQDQCVSPRARATMWAAYDSLYRTVAGD